MAEVVRPGVLDGFQQLLLVVMATLTVLAAATAGVQAVDIQGFSSSSDCSGSGYTFAGIAQRVCASMSVGAVLIRDLSSCQTARVYGDGGCTTLRSSGNGPNVRCFVGGSFTGADWLNGCRRRRKLQEAAEVHEPSYKCTGQEVPNGVHYTEHPSMGSWVLETPNATDVMDQLVSIDDAEKAIWLRALGAYYVAGTHTMEVVTQ